mgnify:CR=1 FL=1
MNRKLVALFLSLVMSMSTATVYQNLQMKRRFKKKNIENVQEDKNYTKWIGYLNKIILI